jgi:hypothetical protein
MRREVAMVFIILFSALIIPPEVEAGAFGSVDPGVSDVPDWRVGDKWIYAGAFDPTTLVQDAGVDATVGKINGDATTTVNSIEERIIDNLSTMVYLTSSTADFDKGGVQLDGYTGNLYIKYQVDEVVRVSDLATINTALSLDVEYVPYGISSLTQQIADITISTSREPAKDDYDFPLRDGENWNTTYTSSTSWSGSSDYITPFPAPTSGVNHTNWEVTDIGKPINGLGEQIGYGGCNASYELKSYDDNGTETSFKWYCPEVRNYAWSHTEEDIGLVIDFRLKQYIPVDSDSVESNQNPGTRRNIISVESASTITALNSPMEVWANLTDASGSPVSGADVEIRFESTSFATTVTTGANGTAWASFNVGQELDSSWTSFDWASHGLVAISGSMIGTSTITLDENIVGLDLVAALERASILRNRSGELTTLNYISGFNVLPGDQLLIELPVYNRGVTTSTPTAVHITYPDGMEISSNLPALQLYEEFTFTIQWNIDENASINNLTIDWEVDRAGLNLNDANFNNDLATLPLFIGSAPTSVISNLSGLTNEILQINATNSFDADGGEVWCEFIIPYDDGSRSIAWESITRNNCWINWSWIDDGIYQVIVIIYDEEGDSTTDYLDVAVDNRLPNVEIFSQRSEVKVEHPVTLYVFANDSDSEDSWPGLVDVHWPSATCEEGYYTRTCTTTSWSEGLTTFTAVGTDDDGESTYATIDIVFTNIAPHDVAVSMQDDMGEIIKSEDQMTWRVEEDQEVILIARAEDSEDDLESLSYEWDFGMKTDGRESSVPAVWHNEGLKTIRVKAIDSEDVESGWIERWIDVVNVPPLVEDLPEMMAIAEGQTIAMTGVAYDTPSDRESLVICWDMDPGEDSDLTGSADDDCDVIGENMSWSWQNAGDHTVVFHVTDNDGARSFSTQTITVINMPPIVRIKELNGVIAGEQVVLDASTTIDSQIDREGLMIIWDVDCTRDSDGDGIKDNDADAVGIISTHTFTHAGTWTIKAIAWDEDVMNPASKTMIVVVEDPDRTAFEEVMESLMGDEASPFAQLLAVTLIMTCILLALRRMKKKPESVWENDAPSVEKPLEAPSFDDFQSDEEIVGPPLPEGGLPEGWTMEQWQHYGEQFLVTSDNSLNEQHQD